METHMQRPACYHFQCYGTGENIVVDHLIETVGQKPSNDDDYSG